LISLPKPQDAIPFIRGDKPGPDLEGAGTKIRVSMRMMKIRSECLPRKARPQPVLNEYVPRSAFRPADRARSAICFRKYRRTPAGIVIVQHMPAGSEMFTQD
jgi:hypothetical protein